MLRTTTNPHRVVAECVMQKYKSFFLIFCATNRLLFDHSQCNIFLWNVDWQRGSLNSNKMTPTQELLHHIMIHEYRLILQLSTIVTKTGARQLQLPTTNHTFLTQLLATWMCYIRRQIILYRLWGIQKTIVIWQMSILAHIMTWLVCYHHIRQRCVW